MTNKHFIVGPVELYKNTRNVYQKDFTYFRSDEYSKIVQNTLSELSSMVGNHEENSLIYFAASGSGAMEAVVENCISSDDKSLVINGGTFGRRFCQLLEHHKNNFSSVDLKWDEPLTKEHFKPYENKGFTTLFVNLHETSTGQLYDIKILSDFCKRNNMILVVDAISTFLADDYDMDKYGIDVTIISSQKGLCLSPGMSFVSMSKRMIEKVNANEFTSSKYFDFKDYLKNIQRGQTPYTPPVFIMYELQDMLELIKTEGGKDARLNNVKEKCQYFRKKAKEAGLIMPNYPLSNALTPIIFESCSAVEVTQILRKKHRIFVNPSGGALAEKIIRISHLGNITLYDIDDLIEKLLLCIDKVKKHGVKI